MAYKFIKELGSGGMGCVWLAYNDYGEKVAIKMLAPQYAGDELYRTLFERECQTLAGMAHPGVVGILGSPFTDDKGNMYLPMQFVEGINVEQYVRNNGVMTEQLAARYMCRILEAFEYIHNNGIIHRDVKPSNIMITGPDSICVIDFGIVKGRGDRSITAKLGIGTNGYMSPEQFSALDIDQRSDIYSLGCLLHFMVTGTHAITDDGNEQHTRMRISQGEFPSAQAINPSVSPAMQAVIYKAVDKNMMRRFQSAREFIYALEPMAARGMHDGTGTDIFKAMPQGSWTITVGREGCDILLSDGRASRRHLDLVITCEPDPARGGLKRRVLIVDHSSNGTVINGYTYNNIPVKYDFDQRQYIEIRPAGGDAIEWSEVESILRQRIGITEHGGGTFGDVGGTVSGGGGVHHGSGPSGGGDVAADTSEDGFSFWWALLCFCIWPVGVILFFVWRNSLPRRARLSCLIPALPGLTMFAVGFLDALTRL